MLGAESQKQRPENHQNGRERPHFFGFQPPKKFVGSLPPDRSNAGDSMDAFIAHVIAYRSNHVYNRIHCFRDDPRMIRLRFVNAIGEFQESYIEPNLIHQQELAKLASLPLFRREPVAGQDSRALFDGN